MYWNFFWRVFWRCIKANARSSAPIANTNVISSMKFWHGLSLVRGNLASCGVLDQTRSGECLRVDFPSAVMWTSNRQLVLLRKLINLDILVPY
jgi:hypothetical protein